ncbi:hypothetical protein Tco_0008840 [Tanacetum coccineum]
MCKSDLSTEPTLCPQDIDEFDLKDEAALSEYDEVDKGILDSIGHTYYRDHSEAVPHIDLLQHFWKGAWLGRRAGPGFIWRAFYFRRLAYHFGLMSDDRLRGLSVVAFLRPERQQVAMAGALGATEDAPAA